MGDDVDDRAATWDDDPAKVARGAAVAAAVRTMLAPGGHLFVDLAADPDGASHHDRPPEARRHVEAGVVARRRPGCWGQSASSALSR